MYDGVLATVVNMQQIYRRTLVCPKNTSGRLLLYISIYYFTSIKPDENEIQTIDLLLVKSFMMGFTG